jgi:hypothetical protein
MGFQVSVHVCSRNSITVGLYSTQSLKPCEAKGTKSVGFAILLLFIFIVSAEWLEGWLSLESQVSVGRCV